MTLTGVPETALWTLYHRSLAARQGVLEDPKAIELVEQIDYPFAERFGGGETATWQGLRVRAFDNEIRTVLRDKPDATVVALGEGLETQFWRVDNGSVRWVTVDLPETIELRERLLPVGDRLTAVACSAFDEAWMEQVDPASGVLVTAQGLFMYFDFADVERLVGAMRRRFPGGTLVFDAVPNWQAKRSRKPRSDGGYQSPPWQWGIDKDKRRALGAERLDLPRGRGVFFGVVSPLLRLDFVEILHAHF